MNKAQIIRHLPTPQNKPSLVRKQEKNSEKTDFINKGYRRPILDILADFQQPIPDRFISKKPVFKKRNDKSYQTGEVDYVPWMTYIRLLEYYAPGFDWQVRVQYLGDRTVIEGRLTIRTKRATLPVKPPDRRILLFRDLAIRLVTPKVLPSEDAAPNFA